MAMEMRAYHKSAARYMDAQGLDPNGKYAMFVLRPWDDSQEWLDQVVRAADHVYEEYGLTPVFYSFEPHRDESINAMAAQRVKAPCKLLASTSDGALLCGLIARMELVVSMRLHALIFACSQQTRIVGISYDPKVSGFMDYLGSRNCVDLGDLTTDLLREKISDALREPELSPNLSHLRDLAAENGRLAGKLLRGETIS